MNHPIKEMIIQRMNGISIGMYSICSANELVIQAAMIKAMERHGHVLIEATANQVNQFGGYTGMKPADFTDYVFSIAKRIGFPKDKVILGGDHLGPLIWQDKTAEEAMLLAKALIESFVLAGFSKIHLDTSMKCSDDKDNFYQDIELISNRGAILCKAAEKAFVDYRAQYPDAIAPVYVIGSEVPVPGGVKVETGMHITSAEDLKETVDTYHQVFMSHHLEHAWERILAVVVQPGVEFSDDTIHDYRHEQAKPLHNALQHYPFMVFEGHSTDYQTPKHLREMVVDGIAILKVGPALTHALREAFFSLESMEKELLSLYPKRCLSCFSNILEDQMLTQPNYWEGYYHGTSEEKEFARKFSFSDRIRYYLPLPGVANALQTLFTNLEMVTLPLSLLSQYMPVQYRKIRENTLKNRPLELVLDYVMMTIEDYEYATR